MLIEALPYLLSTNNYSIKFSTVPICLLPPQPLSECCCIATARHNPGCSPDSTPPLLRGPRRSEAAGCRPAGQHGTERKRCCFSPAASVVVVRLKLFNKLFLTAELLIISRSSVLRVKFREGRTRSVWIVRVRGWRAKARSRPGGQFNRRNTGNYPKDCQIYTTCQHLQKLLPVPLLRF